MGVGGWTLAVMGMDDAAMSQLNGNWWWWWWWSL